MIAWDWSNVVSFGALGVSVLALVLSWLAYRQRIKFHPQPKLVASWDRSTETSNGVPLRYVAIKNHGDATARDLTVVIPSSARGADAWDSEDELEPGHTWRVMVPLVTGADWGYGGYGPTLKAGESEGIPVLPRLEVQWRQAPFDGRKRRLGIQTPS